MSMSQPTIAGWGMYVPERVMTNHDLEAIVDTTDEWITSRTGIRQRHIAAPDESSSSMGIIAARRAIERAELTTADIDLVIVGTATPDYQFPATGCLIQDALGISGGAFDLEAGCTSFMYAFSIACSFVAGGMYRNVLVVGTETLSRILDWNDRATCVLFGDGAGAVVLETSDTPGILASDLHADGKHVGILCVPGTVSGGKVLGDPLLKMDGQAVFKLAVGVLEDAARAALKKAERVEADVDWLIPHQANIRIMQSTAKRLKLPIEKLIVTVDRHGNTSAASIPLALDDAVRSGKVKKGDTVMLEGVGGGFTWGAVLLDL
jgi:3-oxoacyl-[acyl-carrier-protein] synthase III